MNYTPSQFERPSDMDAYLQQLLQTWADQRRLSPFEVESIRRAVVETDVETVAPLPDGWWQYFRERFQAVLNQATTLSCGLQHGYMQQPAWYQVAPGKRTQCQPYVKIVLSC